MESLTRSEIDLLIAECMTMGEFASDWGIARKDRPRIVAWANLNPILPLGTTKHPVYFRKDLEKASLGWLSSLKRSRRWAAAMTQISKNNNVI
jgi:hypothetical protein